METQAPVTYSWPLPHSQGCIIKSLGREAIMQLTWEGRERLSLVEASMGYSLVAVSRLLIAVVSLVAEHGL